MTIDLLQVQTDVNNDVIISKDTWHQVLALAISSRQVSAGPISTIDSDQFQDLLNDVCFAFRDDKGGDSQRALIAHIDAYVTARLAAAVPQWISVDERLPEERVEVVVCGPAFNDISKGLYESKGSLYDGVFYDENGDQLHAPLFWIHKPPLPAAPAMTQDQKASKP